MSATLARAGFTLLEVTVALAILAMGLVAIVDINAGATKLHEASQHITIATLLARSKLVDLEAKLNQDGFSDFDKEIDGTFDEEKHPEIRWKAEILKPDLTKSADQITGLISSAIGGGGGSGGMGGLGSGSPLAALLGSSSLVPAGTTLPDMGSSSASSAASSPTTTGLSGLLGGAMTGLIQQQVQGLVQQLQQGVREVRLTVTWPDGIKEDSFTVTTHLIVLNPTGTGVSNGTPVPWGQGSAGNGTTPTGAPGTTLPGTTAPGATPALGAPLLQGGLGTTPSPVMH
jgi:general secretion pathway protein I